MVVTEAEVPHEPYPEPYPELYPELHHTPYTALVHLGSGPGLQSADLHHALMQHLIAALKPGGSSRMEALGGVEGVEWRRSAGVVERDEDEQEESEGGGREEHELYPEPLPALYTALVYLGSAPGLPSADPYHARTQHLTVAPKPGRSSRMEARGGIEEVEWRRSADVVERNEAEQQESEGRGRGEHEKEGGKKHEKNYALKPKDVWEGAGGGGEED
jgi:hypothetical protein